MSMIFSVSSSFMDDPSAENSITFVTFKTTSSNMWTSSTNAVKESTIKTSNAVKDTTIKTTNTVKETTYSAATAVKDGTVKTGTAVKNTTVNAGSAVKTGTLNTASAVKNTTTNATTAVSSSFFGVVEMARKVILRLLHLSFSGFYLSLSIFS